MRQLIKLILIAILLVPSLASAQPLRVAVAANFTGAMQEISAQFSEETGIQVQTGYSSTGKLYAQIKNGAPYDLFLAADAERPDLLFAEELCAQPVIYARGRTVLWSKRSDLVELRDWREVLASKDLRRLALPNPEIAPYGRAARTAMINNDQWATNLSHLVYAQNVAQAFQYGEKRAADAAFTSLSFALSGPGQQGRYWEIDAAPVVVQKGCLLARSKNQALAARFLAFLASDKARPILAAYGYR